MAALSWILYFLGFVCTIMGIITVIEVIPILANITGPFWLMIGGVLFLASIAGFIVQSKYE